MIRMLTMSLVYLCSCLVVRSITAQESRDFQPRQAWTTSRLQGAPTPPPAYEIKPAFPCVRFERPTSVEEIPAEKRLLVTQMDGRVLSLSIDKSTPEADVVGNLDDVVGKDVSLLSATLHPKFPRQKYLFASYVHQDANSITLKTADKTTITVLRENIDELTKNPQSLMPEQLLSDLTAQEAADLIAFVRGLK